ncbi:MAG: ATPase, T2SS/T4P/T4SS family [Candidatus Hydrogenedentota bacterium]
MTMYEKEHLGALLVRAGIISDSQLSESLKEADRTDRRLGEVLISKGYTSEEQVIEYVSIQLGYPTVKLDHTRIDAELAREIPEKFARRYGVLPLYRTETTSGSVVVVAMTDPANIMVHDELNRALGEIFVTLTTQGEMSRHLDRIWMSSPQPEPAPVRPETHVLPEAEEEVKPSVAMILEMLFRQAFDLRATSVHLEPKQKFVSVRYKVDGRYHTVTSLPKETYQAVLARIKILSKIAIAESVIDIEEGRFHIRPDLAQPIIDIRVTIIPAMFGEKCVLKITRRDEVIRPLSDLGFEKEQWEIVNELLKKPTGLLLISGKNDSGKTTLAYSVLSRIGDASNMVVTIEDPPAYPISGFNQVTKFGSAATDAAKWALTLKAVERQEPNIVYMSFIDTREEMKMMLRLSSTGRRVIGTLYADDASSAHWVMLQLGADSFAIASALSGTIHVRLVRLICEACRKEVRPDAALLARVGIPAARASQMKFYEGAGCGKCGGTGFMGRTGVFEVMVAHDHVSEMIASKSPADLLRQAAIDSGMMTMREAALAKLDRGITTLAEVATVLL